MAISVLRRCHLYSRKPPPRLSLLGVASAHGYTGRRRTLMSRLAATAAASTLCRLRRGASAWFSPQPASSTCRYGLEPLLRAAPVFC